VREASAEAAAAKNQIRNTDKQNGNFRKNTFLKQGMYVNKNRLSGMLWMEKRIFPASIFIPDFTFKCYFRRRLILA
jgi:hypothetical protein